MEEISSKTEVAGNATVNLPDIKEFLKAGVQFGHETVRWNPKMKPYIYGVRNKIHIIDLQKTLPLLNEAVKFLTEVSKTGPVLFVATKRQARELVEKYAIDSGSYFVTYRWLGGLLTNFKMIKKSLLRYNQIEEEFEKGVVNRTKFEINQLKKEWERMNRIYKGVKSMDRFPVAVIVVDCHYEKGAVMEARAANIPVVSLVDTNSDPDLVDYVIPANDDALKSLELLLSILAGAVKQGNQGRGIKHTFKDYINYEVQIIKEKKIEAIEEKIINLEETKIKDEPTRILKSRKRSSVTKGILELVKDEADNIKEAKKIEKKGPVKKKEVVTKKIKAKKTTKIKKK